MTNQIDCSDLNNFTSQYWTDKWFKYKNFDKVLQSFFCKNEIYLRHPWEVIGIYKTLLKYLKRQNSDRYKQVHKGTPFFWIGWNSFLLKNYDQAIFYLDAALAEDKKNHPSHVWPTSGAAMFFKLQTPKFRIYYDRGYVIAPELYDIVNRELNRFNSKHGNNLSINHFIDSFVTKILKEDNTAVITTLYAFIFQKDDIIEMIKLRGKHGGSIEPMITHLFKGALIFETLMKENHPQEGNSLGKIIGSSNIQTRYNYNQHHCRASSLEEIFSFINSQTESAERAFYVTCKIRNTTAHNLIWNDLFTIENYNKLYYSILDAIFYVIQKEY